MGRILKAQKVSYKSRLLITARFYLFFLSIFSSVYLFFYLFLNFLQKRIAYFKVRFSGCRYFLGYLRHSIVYQKKHRTSFKVSLKWKK